MTKLKILLADDHAVLREGMKTLINAEPDMEVTGEAANGHEAVERAKALAPDLAVLDLSMPELNGAQATRRIKAAAPGVKVLALTVHEDKSYLLELLEAGASGYVLKRASKGELILAIRAVMSGGVYIDPRIASQLMNPFTQGQARAAASTPALSDRESSVMRLVARGYTNKEVASDLDISVKTVETYRARSMEKLGLKSRVDLIRIATERGWLQAS